jgi:hypothetical protein
MASFENPWRLISVWSLALACLALLLVRGAAPPDATAASAPVTITNYTDPTQALKWGNRSHWKQPWRSYLDTVSATTLLKSVGINFNVLPKWAASTARLLADSGFRRARIEVGWGTLDYDDPSRMNEVDRQSLVTKLTALRDNGIRPLILLNANHGKPCPTKPDTVTLTTPAPAGATTIHVDPRDVNKIVLGRTGIRSDGVAAQYLFISVNASGTVHLSTPLVSALPAGPLDVETLRYEPFRPETLANGSPNPRFEPTMQGWLNYVRVVTREVKSILGSDNFDVEIWNELSFGSRFLNINGYYEPDIEWRDTGNLNAILFRTVGFLRDPASGVAGVGIGNGFANQAPSPNGNESPVGLTAIDKHPYSGWQAFPQEAKVDGERPLNGLGLLDGWKDAANQFHESFTPTYDSFFPEYFLSGIQGETLVHDLSPYPSKIAGVEHGRFTHPPGGAPPKMWITEVNLGPASGPTARATMTQQDIRHIETKDVLRYLAAYVNKGVTAIDFYAATGGDLSLIDQSFFDAVKANSFRYPGDAQGGETTDAVRRFTASLHGAKPLASPRSLSLRALTDYSGNVQFEGNGTAAYPPLYNRDVFAFFPFQVNRHRFVIPTYVMTRNVAKVYRSGSDPTRFDLDPEPYRMAIGGVRGKRAKVTATDPLTGEAVRVRVVSRSRRQIVVKMPVTDSPRLLMIEERGLRLHMRLRGRRALLHKRRMAAVVRCNQACKVRAVARLVIGRRIVHMHAVPRHFVFRRARAKARIKLAVGRRGVRAARHGFQRGARVRLSVTAYGRNRAGLRSSLRRVVPLH